MYGICGKLIFKDSIPAPDSIRAMCKTIMHRGPDAEGIYIARHIGFWPAAPPLADEDKTVWVVLSG